MAYAYTVDERYGGSFFSAYAGYRDAANSTSTAFVLAPGYFNAAYGALIPGGFSADQDAYSMGLLAPGKYTVRAAGYNWDFSNAIFGGSVNTVGVYDAFSNLIGSSYLGAVSFEVYTTGTFIVSLSGYSFSGTEYELYYTYDGPLTPVNYVATSGTLVVSGTLMEGSTVLATGTFSDQNGTSQAVQSFQWYRSNDLANWAVISGATSISYTLTSADRGLYVGYTLSFVDDAGFSEVVGASTGSTIAALDQIPGNASTGAVLSTQTGTVTSSIDAAGDTDWFGVSLNAGTTYVFDLAGSGSGSGSLVDPWLAVRNGSGGVLASGDSGGKGALDARVIYTPTATGTYYLSAEEFGNDANGSYTLSMAAPTATALPTTGAGVAASIASSSEEDWFVSNLTAGVTYIFSLKGVATGSGTLADPVLKLYASSGSMLWTSDDGGIGKNSLINFTPVSSGAYALSVTGFSAGTGSYRILNLPNDASVSSGAPQFSGNNLIDATTHGYAWSLGASRTITWGLADSGAWSWTNAQSSADQIAAILATVEAVANIRFEYGGYFPGAAGLATAASAGIDISIAFDAAFFSSTNVWGRSYFPSAVAQYNPYQNAAGDILLNPSSLANGLSYEPGSAGYFLILHELGHSLGLKHPHDDGGTNHPTFAQASIPAYLDEDWATVMSYQDDYNWNLTSWDPATPMVLDVQALQYLYGANQQTNSGNSTHLLFANGQYQTIWDAGGHDTVDASGSGFGWTISFSVSGDNLGGALRSDELALSSPTSLYWLMGAIEDVIGSAQADTITGNSLANVLSGIGGHDSISGGGGNDTLTGGAGADTLIGGPGDDTFFVDTQSDLVFENPGEGTDTLVTPVSFYLYANIEGITLASGAGGIFGSANELANTMVGNEGNNLLLGWGGNDTISGNAGADVLYGLEGDDSLLGGAGIDNLIAGNGNDTLDGGADPDAIYGEVGNDLMFGGTGFFTDILVGGVGDDTLDGSASVASGQTRNQGDYDLMNGGAGDDTYFVDTPSDLTFEALNDGIDSVIADINGGGYYLYANVENLTLTGNTPFGVGNGLDNQLTGSALANWLLGGAGNDRLNGGAGNDVLFGEGGADTFVFNRGSGGDVIGDFVPGTDKINIAGIGYSSFAQVQARMVQNGGSTALDLAQGDFVVLVGVAREALSAGDFVLA